MEYEDYQIGGRRQCSYCGCENHVELGKRVKELEAGIRDAHREGYYSAVDDHSKYGLPWDSIKSEMMEWDISIAKATTGGGDDE